VLRIPVETEETVLVDAVKAEHVHQHLTVHQAALPTAIVVPVVVWIALVQLLIVSSIQSKKDVSVFQNLVKAEVIASADVVKAEHVHQHLTARTVNV
jgi:predicted SAM-dependent methyltransferase